MPVSSPVRLPAVVLLVAVLDVVVPALRAQTPVTHAPGAPAAPTAEVHSIRLGDGTSVRLRMMKTISSETAQVGDEVRFRVAEDVKVDGFVVIARNTDAVGHVAAVEKKRRKGKPGTLTLAIDSVDLITGGVASLRSTNEVKGRGENIAGDAAELTLRTYGFGLPFTPLLLLAKGKDVTISRGVPLTAYVNRDLPLNEDELRQVQPPPEPTNGPATVFIYRLPVAPLVSRPIVYCGVVELGALAPGKYMSVHVPPGEYLFQSSGTKHKAKLKLEPARTYYVLLSISMMFKGNLDEVNRTIGEDWIAVLDPSPEKAEVDLTAANPEELRSLAKPKRPESAEEYQEPQ